ncbi:MAG TPA: DUF2059 domain-containing protein [Desulfomonilaceae bacterium]|nr:DUF2059 domain-containing protein [Desulfomonilaceae bacterium]
MKKLSPMILILVLVFSQAARADEAKQRQLSEELLLAMHVDKNMPVLRQMMVNALIPPIIEGQLQGQPEKAQALIKTISDSFAQGFTWENLKQDYVNLYAGMFSAEELQALIDFFKSPVGLKYVEKSPELAQKSMEIGQKKGMELAEQIDQALKAQKEK